MIQSRKKNLWLSVFSISYPHTGVTRGKNQCLQNAIKWSPFLKDWFQNHQEVVLNLKEWLCIEKIQVCCLDEHFGPNCQKCTDYGKNGKVCSGNGKCKGSGSRKGTKYILI